MTVPVTTVGSWLLYEAVFPLSPVLLVWGGSSFLPKKKKGLFELIRDGQLFFFCTAMVAVLLRDLGKSPPGDGGLLYGFLYLLLVAFGVLFGFVALNKDDVDPVTLGRTSISAAVLVVALVLGIRVTENLL
jgi:hypothetical protein